MTVVVALGGGGSTEPGTNRNVSVIAPPCAGGGSANAKRSACSLGSCSVWDDGGTRAGAGANTAGAVSAVAARGGGGSTDPGANCNALVMLSLRAAGGGKANAKRSASSLGSCGVWGDEGTRAGAGANTGGAVTAVEALGGGGGSTDPGASVKDSLIAPPCAGGGTDKAKFSDCRLGAARGTVPSSGGAGERCASLGVATAIWGASMTRYGKSEAAGILPASTGGASAMTGGVGLIAGRGGMTAATAAGAGTISSVGGRMTTPPATMTALAIKPTMAIRADLPYVSIPRLAA